MAAKAFAISVTLGASLLSTQSHFAAARPSATAAASGACIIMFYTNGWSPGGPDYRFGTIMSPAYVLAAKDCPEPVPDSQDAVYYASGPPNFTAKPAPGLRGPRADRGTAMVLAFSKWLAAKPHTAPITGYTIDQSGLMNARPATALYRDFFTRQPGAITLYKIKRDSGAAKIVPGVNNEPAVRGWCIDYLPAGITPIAVLGKANCTTMIR